MSRESSGTRAWRAPCVLQRLAVTLLLAHPLAADAGELGLKHTSGIAVSLSAPRLNLRRAGEAQSLKAFIGINEYLDLSPTVSILLRPSATEFARSGAVWALGAGLRLKRPHDAQRFAGLSPWLDANALYVRAGPLAAIGFDVALGLSVAVGPSRTVWVGPFFRLLDVVAGEHAGDDSLDSKVLTVGISVEIAPRAAPVPAQQSELAGDALPAQPGNDRLRQQREVLDREAYREQVEEHCLRGLRTLRCG